MYFIYLLLQYHRRFKDDIGIGKDTDKKLKEHFGMGVSSSEEEEEEEEEIDIDDNESGWGMLDDLVDYGDDEHNINFSKMFENDDTEEDESGDDNNIYNDMKKR